MHHYIVNFEIMDNMGHAVDWGNLQIYRLEGEMLGTADFIRKAVHESVTSQSFPDFHKYDVRIVGVFKL